MRIYSYVVKIYSLAVIIYSHDERIVTNAVLKCFVPGTSYFCMAGQDILFLQRIGDGRYHAQLLDIRRVLVAVVNLELSLTGRLYTTQAGVARLRKLFRRLLCILDSLCHHLGLHLLERSIIILGIAVLDCHTLFQKLCLTEDSLVHLFHLAGSHRDCCRYDVAEALVVLAPLTCFKVVDGWRVYGYFLLVKSILFQEALDR